MLGSLRADLIVLRGSRAVWAALAVAPVIALISLDVDSYVQYLTWTPLPTQPPGLQTIDISIVSPSQFVDVALQGLLGLGTPAAMVVGVLVAGADWERGTIRTSLLAGPSRLRTLAGQVIALCVALVASVLVTFLATGLFALMVRLTHGSDLPPGTGAFPAAGVVGRAILVAVLVTVVYGLIGLTAGTLVRSVGAGIVLCLIVNQGIEGALVDLGAHGIAGVLYHHAPVAASNALGGLFGTVGGGLNQGVLLPMGSRQAVITLMIYAVACLLIMTLLLQIRDVTDSRGTVQPGARWPRARKAASPPEREPAPSRRGSRPVSDRGIPAFAASVRTELFIIRRWPAAMALIIGPPLYFLIYNYAIPYGIYRSAGPAAGGSSGLAPLQPNQLLPGVLNGLLPGLALVGVGPLMLLGAWIGGSSWNSGTIRASVLQAPGRACTVLGQGAAVAICAIISEGLVFLVAGIASELVALFSSGQAPTGGQGFPSLGHLATAFGLAALTAVAYVTLGWAAGHALRSAGAATALVLVWYLTLQPSLDQVAVEFRGIAADIFTFLPDAATATVGNYAGQSGNLLGSPAAQGPHLAVDLSVTSLAMYAIAFALLPALLARWRDMR